MSTLAIIVTGFLAITCVTLTLRHRVSAIALVLLCLPTYVIRFSIAGIPTTTLEVLILTLFFTTAVSLFLRKNTPTPLHTAGRFSPLQLFYWSAGVLLIAGIFSLLVTPDLRAGLGLFKAYLLEPILFAWVVLQTVRTTADVRVLVRALTLSAAVVAITAVVQYATGWHIPEPWNLFPDRRATAWYGFPNAIGLYLAPLGSFLFALLVRGWFVAPREKKMVTGVLVFILVALIAARADGALVACAVAAVAVLFTTRFRAWTLGFSALTLLLLLLFTPTRDILLFQDVSGDVRLALWRGTTALIQENPLMGAGLAGFPLTYNVYRLPSHVELLEYPHQLFLDFWVELGILGLIWIVSVLHYSGMTLKNGYRSGRPLSVALVAALVSIVVYGLVDVPYFKNDLSVLFWFWFSLVLVVHHLEKKK